MLQQGENTRNTLIVNMVVTIFLQGVCFYLGIGYLHRNSEDPNVILCVWDMIFESVLK